MNVDGPIYAAVIIAICSSLVAAGVGGWVLWRIYQAELPSRPIAGILLFVILAMAVAQAMEQTRVLVFRLSYDHLIASVSFSALYNSTWNVVSSKLLMSMAVAAGSMLQLALACRRNTDDVRRFVALGWMGTFAGWIVLALLLEVLL